MLLIFGRVYRHIQVLERPIEMLFEGRRVQRPRGVAAAVPAAAAPLSEGLEADPRGDSADQRGDRCALEEFPALAGLALLRFHGFVLSFSCGEPVPVEGSLAAAGKRGLSAA